MGFCLAELGFNLATPKDPASFAASWPQLAAFAVPFVFVTALWWYHHKLFLTYFVLNPLTVVLNFTMLGCLALTIYFQQVAARFMIAGDSPGSAILCWMAALAVVFGIITLQYVIGIVQRRATLDADDMRWGVNRAFRTSVVTVVCVTFALTYLEFHHLQETVYAIAAMLVILNVLRRIFVPRIVAALLARQPA